MNNFIFIINFWLKFLYQIYILIFLKMFYFFKYWLYIKKFKYILNFVFLYQNLIYKSFLNLYVKKFNILNSKNINYLKKDKIKKNYIQKGLKFEKLGIYPYNLYSLNKNLQKNNNNFIFLIRFKRKNLFLTLLNNDGNVLCKTNIGSCGFKKKVKYTGYAIKRTSRIFLEKILKKLIYNIYYIYYTNSLKKKKKKKTKIWEKLIKYIFNKKLKYFKIIKNYNFIKKIKLIKNTKLKIKIKRKKKKSVITRIWKETSISKKMKIKKKKWDKSQNLKIIKKKKKLNLKFIKYKKLYLIFYRNYDKYLKIFLKNKLRIILRIKSNLKFWGFRFVIYGLTNQFYLFRNLEIRVPTSHSTSLRLKKKRRI
jgi:hypothetical protein